MGLDEKRHTGLPEFADQRATHGRSLRVAVVGAGIAGLTASRILHDRGHEVRVFEKGRAVGGRTSIRRREPFHFDHGAQYFTVRDDRFARYVASWQEAGVVAPWEGRMVSLENGVPRITSSQVRYVGVPGMNAVAKQVAAGLNIATETRVVNLVEERGGYRLSGDDGRDLGTSDVVLVALPAAQAAELLDGVSDLAEQARACPLLPCWAVMLGFEEPLTTPFDAAFVHDSPLAWVARNNTKPGRSSAEAWVLHARSDWSSAHVDEAPEAAADALAAAFRPIAGSDAQRPIHIEGHRWRYALPPEPLDVGALWQPDGRLAICSDWCHGARVEGAFLSGMAAAKRVLAM